MYRSLELGKQQKWNDSREMLSVVIVVKMHQIFRRRWGTILGFSFLFLFLNLLLLPPHLILCYATCTTQTDWGFFPLMGEHITSNIHPLYLVIAAELVCLISASLAKQPSNIQSVPPEAALLFANGRLLYPWT